MKVLTLCVDTHADRMGTLKFISALAQCCDQCHAVAATMMALFKAAVHAVGLSELELRQLRQELTPDNATPDEIAFLDNLMRDLGEGPNS